MAVLLCASACSEGEAALGPAGSLGTAPTTTSTTARIIDPAVIPEDLADIDEAYVQVVVDALFEVDAKATEIFVETQEVDEDAVDILRGIYLPEEVERQVNIWEQDLALRSDELLVGVLHNDVQRVIDVTEDCVYVEVRTDYSDVTTRDAPLRSIYLGLTPKIDGDDSQQVNPTSWMLFMDGLDEDESEPENPCAGR
ncbi:hypothetical protein BH24ACT2_BH24ACT2_05500 [soil metagenome]